MTKKKGNKKLLTAKRKVEDMEEKLIPLRLTYARELVNAEWDRIDETYGKDHLDYEYLVMDLEHTCMGLWEHQENYKKGKLEKDVFEDTYFHILNHYKL